MSLIETILLAIALSMDAFAVAVCVGLNTQKANLKKALIVGLYFGIFQGAMPVIGYFAARHFTHLLDAYAPIIAAALLFILGGRMIYNSLQKEAPENCTKSEDKLGPLQMLPLALATSIDALAVGVSFAFMEVQLLSAVMVIALITFLVSALGVRIGGIFGTRFKAKAEFAGGVILLIIALRVLVGVA